jgi:hypothetical protein
VSAAAACVGCLARQIIDAFKVFDADNSGMITGASQVLLAPSLLLADAPRRGGGAARRRLWAEARLSSRRWWWWWRWRWCAAADLKHVMTSIGEKLSPEQVTRVAGLLSRPVASPSPLPRALRRSMARHEGVA